MTVPRTVSLRRTPDGYRIAQAPVREIDAARRAPRSLTATLGATPVDLPVAGGSAEVEVDLDTGSAGQVIIALNDAQGYQTLVGVNPGVDEVFVDRTRSGPHFADAFADRHVAPVDLKSGKVRLRILADESILEVFADGGTRTITDRFFRGGGPLRWSASARGGTASIRLTAWPMRP